jgi:hypothetical protein
MTKTKLKFNDDMRQHVPPEQLWNEFHGDLAFDYDHDIYWPKLLETCQLKHDERYERWVEAGKHFGESEAYLRGGKAKSVANGVVEESKAAEKKDEAATESSVGAPADDVKVQESEPVPSTGA